MKNSADDSRSDRVCPGKSPAARQQDERVDAGDAEVR